MPGGETDGASGGSSGASSSSGRTSVALDVGCLEPFVTLHRITYTGPHPFNG